VRSGSVTLGALGDDGDKTPSQDVMSAGVPAGGFMGRLRNFTRSSSKRTPTEVGGLNIVTPGGVLANLDVGSNTGVCSDYV